MPKEKFDKDIELARLNAWISEKQAQTYSIVIFFLTAGLSAYLALLAVLVLYPNLSPNLSYVGSAILIFCVAWAFFFPMRGHMKDVAKQWQYFEDIYNKRRPEIKGDFSPEFSSRRTGTQNLTPNQK